MMFRERRIRLRRFRRPYGASLWLGGAGIAIAAVFAFVVPPLMGLDATAADPMNVLKPSSLDHLFGTDQQGRDILTRVLIGMRVSLLIGATVSIATFTVGIPLKILAAYSRPAEAVIMRVVDAAMSIPGILLALALMAVIGPGLKNVLIVLIVMWTPLTIRMARGAAMEVLSQDYIAAAVASGSSLPSIIRRHVVRNAIDPVLVQQTIAFAGGILGEVTFSFVGAGVQPPQPSLGDVLADAQLNLSYAPWPVVLAGLVVVLLVLSIVMFGDGIRSIFAIDQD